MSTRQGMTSWRCPAKKTLGGTPKGEVKGRAIDTRPYEGQRTIPPIHTSTHTACALIPSAQAELPKTEKKEEQP